MLIIIMLACHDFLQVPRGGAPSTLQMMGSPALQVGRFRNRSRHAFCTCRRVCFVANHRLVFHFFRHTCDSSHVIVLLKKIFLCNLFGGKVNE